MALLGGLGTCGCLQILLWHARGALAISAFQSKDLEVPGKKWYQPASETPPTFVPKQRESIRKLVPHPLYLPSPVHRWASMPSALLRAHPHGTVLSICLLIYPSRFPSPLHQPTCCLFLLRPVPAAGSGWSFLTSPLRFQGVLHGWKEVQSLITFPTTTPDFLQTQGSSANCPGQAKGDACLVAQGLGQGNPSVFCCS